MATACVNTNQSNLDKIENFLNDPAYKEALESSANFNSRLCIERRMRLPFLDSQTGLAQNHSSLLMHKRQRMPGIAPGQIYIYPRHRWRKKRRQYLTMNARAFARAADHMLDGDLDMHSISQVENPALQDTDSKDSQLLLKDEVSKEWFYDGDDMLEMDPYDEPDQDSDLDYEETYNKRANKRRKGTGRGRGGSDSPSTPGRRKGSGRGRKKTSMHNFDPTPGDPDKPFACELCGARYKTRPGLTYHYGHSHKEGASDENSRDSLAQNPTSTSSPQVGVPPVGNTQMPGGAMGIPSGGGLMQTNPTNLLGEPTPNVVPVPPQLQGPPTQGHVYQDSYVSFLNHPAGSPAAGGGRRGRQNVAPPPPSSNVPPSQAPPTLPPNLPAPLQPPLDDPPMPVLVPEKNIEPPTTTTTSSQSATAAAAATATASSSSTIANAPSGDVPPIVKDKAVPSPYCDFCLGDSRENKKTGGSEELVSCSDCGRSGHPSCLQFTANMIISVKKYRWQCIECKCCSVCGTSDNDDQLLFCDDCDRGYHMYCLTPPLNSPPEGSWSCKLCIDEFHK